MSITSLNIILPPPTIPLEVPRPNDWDNIEQQIIKLPDDYKAFINCYGSGTLDNFLWILNPMSKNEHGNLLKQIEPVIDGIRVLKRDWPDQHPYNLYPEPGGLLPFGGTDNGDALFWQTVGEPNNWPVIVNAARDPDYEKFEIKMTDFLAALLTRRIRCSIFPEGFPSEHPGFTPIRQKI